MAAVSFLLGWWGFPFGPIFTVWALAITLTGGNDVTSMVVARLAPLGRSRPEQASAAGKGAREANQKGCAEKANAKEGH